MSLAVTLYNHNKCTLIGRNFRGGHFELSSPFPVYLRIQLQLRRLRIVEYENLVGATVLITSNDFVEENEKTVLCSSLCFSTNKISKK